MTFTVTYRGKDGALREEAVEAADRAGCVAECRRRGIAPVGIKEGRSGKSAASPKGRDRARPEMERRDAASPRGVTTAKWVVAVAVVLAAIAGGVWWWMGRGGEPKPAGAQPKVEKPKVEKPVAEKPKAKPPRKQSKAVKPAEVAKPAPVEELNPLRLPEGTVISVETNDNDLVISAVIGADGKTNLVTRELHPPVFSNPADQLIAAAMNASMTGQMAPLPLGPESDAYFKEALKRPIPDNPDDTEEVKRMKQVVRETRAQIVELMAQGQSFAEIMAQHQELWNENAKARDAVVAEYRRIVRSGDEEEARRYMERMNEQLGRMGIPPITENDGHSRRKKTKSEDEK